MVPQELAGLNAAREEFRASRASSAKFRECWEMGELGEARELRERAGASGVDWESPETLREGDWLGELSWETRGVFSSELSAPKGLKLPPDTMVSLPESKWS